MSDQDPLCPKSVYYDGVDVPCRCDLIGKVRADERERIALAIEECWGSDSDYDVIEAYKESARIARNVE